MAKARGPVVRTAFLGMLPIAFLGTMAYFLVLVYPQGLLQSWMPLPWWLGG